MARLEFRSDVPPELVFSRSGSPRADLDGLESDGLTAVYSLFEKALSSKAPTMARTSRRRDPPTSRKMLEWLCKNSTGDAVVVVVRASAVNSMW